MGTLEALMKTLQLFIAQLFLFDETLKTQWQAFKIIWNVTNTNLSLSDLTALYAL